MPKIPLSQRAGAIQHVRTAAPINAGGQTLKYYGGDGTAEAFAKAGERIGSGLEKLGHSMLQFARQTQDVENNLAAAEDRALYNERSNALLNQLVSNPGASEEEKNKWIKDFEENYAADRKEITQRMSTAYRTQHDVEMTSLAKTFAAKRSLAIRESSVTGQLNRAMDLYKRSCESGDFEEAKRILHDNKGTLFSEEQVKHFTEHDLPMRQDFFDAKQLAESDPRTALAALNEKNANNEATNFRNLTPDSRQQMIRYAENLADQREQQWNEDMLAQYASGHKVFTDEQAKAMLERSEITSRQYTNILNWNKGLDRANAAKLSQQENARNAAFKQQAYELEYKTLWKNGDAVKITPEQARKIKLEATPFFGNRYDDAIAFYKKVDERVAKLEAGTAWDQTVGGKAVSKFVQNIPMQSFYWDPVGWGYKNDEGFLISNKLEMMQFAEQRYAANKGDVEKTINDINARLKELNDGKITRILDPNAPFGQPKQERKTFDSRKDVVSTEAAFYSGRPLSRKMTAKEISDKKAQGYIDLADEAAGASGAGGLAAGSHPEGTTGKTKDGKKVIMKNGKWIYAK